MSTSYLHDVVTAADLELLTTAEEDLPLGAVLVGVDALALTIAATLVHAIGAAVPARVVDVTSAWFVPAVVLGGLAVLGTFGLHQRRRCAITSVEVSRIGRAGAVLTVAVLLVLQAVDSSAPYVTALATGVLAALLLVLGRGGFRSWLKVQRRLGRFVTPVAVVGHRAAVQGFARHMRRHPESGFRPVAHVDVDPTPLVDLTDDAEALPRIGGLDDDLDDLRRHGVHSAVLLVDGLRSSEVTAALRAAEARFRHVQIVTNLVGVSHARLVPTPLVGEMTFYLEPLATRWQRIAKRTTDVAVSGLLLLLTAPVLALIAAAVRLTDGGPALYTQERIGLGGRRIRIAKFRSMVVDADERLAELAGDNERAGPLFKARRDPRVTPVGRFLRATSLDELPQLWSILVGDMSLVGPRPALPAEVAEFDDVHQRRHEVRPGLTGLWQVEDRDHPDFERYRRHDVFYVENWSLSLDIAILLQTAVVVAMRGAQGLLGRGDAEVIE